MELTIFNKTILFCYSFICDVRVGIILSKTKTTLPSKNLKYLQISEPN